MTREEAIQVLNMVEAHGSLVIKAKEMAIKALEQVPKAGWIPVSEMLPQDGRYICDYGDCIDFGLITNGEWYVDGVIAWQPLPKPYKESEG